MATASSLGAAFYGFGLVLLPTLAFVGFVTFERALQSSIEDALSRPKDLADRLEADRVAVPIAP